MGFLEATSLSSKRAKAPNAEMIAQRRSKAEMLSQRRDDKTCANTATTARSESPRSVTALSAPPAPSGAGVDCASVGPEVSEAVQLSSRGEAAAPAVVSPPTSPRVELKGEGPAAAANGVRSGVDSADAACLIRREQRPRLPPALQAECVALLQQGHMADACRLAQKALAADKDGGAPSPRAMEGSSPSGAPPQARVALEQRSPRQVQLQLPPAARAECIRLLQQGHFTPAAQLAQRTLQEQAAHPPTAATALLRAAERRSRPIRRPPPSNPVMKAFEGCMNAGRPHEAALLVLQGLQGDQSPAASSTARAGERLGAWSAARTFSNPQ